MQVSFSEQSVLPRLNIVGPTYALWGGVSIAGPLYFFISTNYLSFIDRFELALYRGGEFTSGEPIKTFEGTSLELLEPISWNGELDTDGEIRPGETFRYILRVYDKLGNMDQTKGRSFTVQRYLTLQQRTDLAQEKETILKEFNTKDHTLFRQIGTTGYPVFFKPVKTEDTLPNIGGVTIPPDLQAGFTQILSPGSYVFSVDYEDIERFYLKGSCEYRLRLNSDAPLYSVSGEYIIEKLYTLSPMHKRIEFFVDIGQRYPVHTIDDVETVIFDRTLELATWPKIQSKPESMLVEAYKPAMESILDYSREVFDLSTGARIFTLKAPEIREQSLQVIITGDSTPVILLKGIHYTYYAPKSWVTLTESGESFINETFNTIEISYKAQ
jgi:hypothetical protein